MLLDLLELLEILELLEYLTLYRTFVVEEDAFDIQQV